MEGGTKRLFREAGTDERDTTGGSAEGKGNEIHSESVRTVY
jgi:hypothetical protein